MTRTDSSHSAFVRGGALVSALGIVGLSLASATPAAAASAADCTALNTVTVLSDLQPFLDDASKPIVCIDGTFVLTAGLTVTRALELVGLNGATLDGATLYQIIGTGTGSPLTVDGITFLRGNGAGGIGGAIVSRGSLTVTNSVFESNTAVQGGGAIGAWQNLTVNTSTFRANSGGIGGAIWGYVTTNINDSTFVDNTASNTGGAVAVNNSTITNSTFVTNTAGGNGGAVGLQGSGTVVQSTFYDNSAGNGQAMNVLNPRPTSIRGSIFATSTGLRQLTGFTLTDNGGNVFTTPQATEASFTPAVSTMFEQTIPLIFGTNVLASNGGPTDTIALPSGSVALDVVPAGTPLVPLDQRGQARTVPSDAGSYELIAAEPALAATGSSSAGVLAAFGAALLALGFVVRRATRTAR